MKTLNPKQGELIYKAVVYGSTGCDAAYFYSFGTVPKFITPTELTLPNGEIAVLNNTIGIGFNLEEIYPAHDCVIALTGWFATDETNAIDYMQIADIYLGEAKVIENKCSGTVRMLTLGGEDYKLLYGNANTAPTSYTKDTVTVTPTSADLELNGEIVYSLLKDEFITDNLGNVYPKVVYDVHGTFGTFIGRSPKRRSGS